MIFSRLSLFKSYLDYECLKSVRLHFARPHYSCIYSSPIMQSLLDNPQIMQTMLQSNPQIQVRRWVRKYGTSENRRECAVFIPNAFL